VGFYGEKILPRLIDRACGSARFAPWRQRVCEDLSGKVIEIGFGSGLNVPYYSSKIEVVYAIEPESLALKLARKRINNAFVSIEHAGLDGQVLPLSDGSCDAALSSFTLCTVPDPAAVLQEISRVLKRGGQFHFLEHGLAPTPALALTQRLLNPLEIRLAGGCHLDRRPLELIREAGFELLWSDEGPAKGPKPWCYLSAGVAVKI
jgi:ubiquinone/menaquinone biosynthesis C-methylase UbiE